MLATAVPVYVLKQHGRFQNVTLWLQLNSNNACYNAPACEIIVEKDIFQGTFNFLLARLAVNIDIWPHSFWSV